MIGERPLSHDIYAAGAQRPEEPRGIADPGKGQDALAAYRFDLRLGRCCAPPSTRTRRGW